MKKKWFIFAILSVFLILILIVLYNYSNTQKQNKLKAKINADGSAEIAMLIDVGDIDDESFNKGVYDAIVEFGNENNKTYNYYVPEEKSDYAVVDSIENAIKLGAKVIVAPGYWFKRPIDLVQNKYKDIKFILIDTTPYSEVKKMEKIGENVFAILFSEQEGGYLAGYAMVMEGFENIGFMGGMQSPSVENFGYGYIQGINDAAKEKGLEKKSIKLKYMYLGGFEENAEYEYIASSWFAGDTQVIFASAGQAGISVMKAAKKYKDKYVVGVDIDQSSQSNTVITSVVKNSKRAVYDQLKNIYDDKFEGGKYVTYGINDGYIYLEMGNSRFKKFSKEQYDKLVKEMSEGKIKVKSINSKHLDKKFINDFEYIDMNFQF
jgi:hypothetical protein